MRDMVKTREFEEYFDGVQQRMRPVLAELGLETEEDIYEYLESGDAYESCKAKVAAAKSLRSPQP